MLLGKLLLKGRHTASTTQRLCSLCVWLQQKLSQTFLRLPRIIPTIACDTWVELSIPILGNREADGLEDLF